VSVHIHDVYIAVGLFGSLTCLLLDLFVFQPWRHRENWQDGVGFWLLIVFASQVTFWSILASYRWFPGPDWWYQVRDGGFALMAGLAVVLAGLMLRPALRQVQINRYGRHARTAPTEPEESPTP
jgi:hypothetical protein